MQIRVLAALLSIFGGAVWTVRWLLADWASAGVLDDLRLLGLVLGILALISGFVLFGGRRGAGSRVGDAEPDRAEPKSSAGRRKATSGRRSRV